MSIEIKLDRPALLALIKDDETFKLSLSDAVVSEVMRKVFEKDMARLVKEAEPELFKRVVEVLQADADMEDRIKRALDQQLVVRQSWQNPPPMSPALKKIFDDAVANAIPALERKVATILDEKVTSRALEIVEAKLADDDLDARIAKRADRLTNEEIDRRVAAAVQAKVAKLNEALK